MDNVVERKCEARHSPDRVKNLFLCPRSGRRITNCDRFGIRRKSAIHTLPTLLTWRSQLVTSVSQISPLPHCKVCYFRNSAFSSNLRCQHDNASSYIEEFISNPNREHRKGDLFNSRREGDGGLRSGRAIRSSNQDAQSRSQEKP